MRPDLLVFDSHPVQYRVPVWEALEKCCPSCVHVIYASDCSVKGYADKGFGQMVAWNEPLLEGYSYTILHNENGTVLSGWRSLTGKGVRQIIKKYRPKAILLTGLNYQYDLIAAIQAKRMHIPLWLRCETQDEASYRTKLKSLLRSTIYQFVYRFFDHFFYIGELNRQHYLSMKVPLQKLSAARYATINRFTNLTKAQKISTRVKARQLAGISIDAFVVGFSGKLISKKNPDILFSMLKYMGEELRKKISIYIMGSGELEPALKEMAQEAYALYKVRTFFAGFINQSELASHYLAMDVLVLPSRRMGETWGLVVNEAMQAGCSVVVSDAVGSSADFSSFERFKVFKQGEDSELVECLTSLAKFRRSFNWADELLEDYSMDSVAKGIVDQIEHLKNANRS